MNDPYIASHIRDVHDFPKPGIVYKDISPLLASSKARYMTTELLVRNFRDQAIDVVIGIESRGFLFGMLIADALNARFVMMRKPGKLPGDTLSQSYQLEYGHDTLQLQSHAVQPGDRVLVHDDVLATGGTLMAALKLIELAGGTVAGVNTILEIVDLKGRDLIKEYKTVSLLRY